MLRYFYAWTPLVIVTTVVFLSLPWLALIALMVVTLLALAALALAIVVAPYVIVRAVARRRRRANAPSPRTAPALPAARPRTRSVPAGATVLLANTQLQGRHLS